jgi:hypothetical protein
MNKRFLTPIVFILLVSLIHSTASGKTSSDSLFINIDQHNLKKKDTLSFDCTYKYEGVSRSRISLDVIIENIEKTKQWKFRYPLVNGNVSPSIVVGDEIPEGKYAITFLIHNDFLSIKGLIKDFSPKSKGYNYLLLTKNKDSYIGFLTPESAGYFTTPRMIFEDTARIIFSENGRKYQNLYIDLKTFLDSTYKPISMMTDFITIGSIKNKMDTTTKENYKFDLEKNKRFTLEEVTVKSFLKKKVDLFDEEYSSGLFKFGFPQIFDGLESPQIGNSMDLFNFLQGRVAGLQVKRDVMGNYILQWRGSNVDVFLDEFKVENEMASYVNTNDIAMIKVFSPMSGGPTGNGAIAIYTKRGAYYNENSTRRYNFQVFGYSPMLSIWK